MEIRKGENIYLNMPEASENTIKANIICKEGNPSNLPQKIRKTQMIPTKRLWKKEKEKGKKIGSLCLILQTYIMLTLRAGGQMAEAHTRNIKSIWKTSCPPDTTLLMPGGQNNQHKNAYKSLRFCH